MKRIFYFSVLAAVLFASGCIPIVTTVKEHSQFQDYKNSKKEVFNALSKILKNESFQVTHSNYSSGEINAEKGTIMNSGIISEGIDAGVASASVFGLYAKVGRVKIETRTFSSGNGKTRLSVRALSGDAEFNRKLTDIILKKVELELM